MLKKPVHMMWQCRMTWRLPKSPQTSRWKTAWESERQDRMSEEGVCSGGQTQHNRNSAEEKVMKRYREEEAEKESVLAHNDSTPSAPEDESRCGLKMSNWVSVCICNPWTWVAADCIYKTAASLFPISQVIRVAGRLLSVCVLYVLADMSTLLLAMLL